jgi:hypothetical protein
MVGLFLLHTADEGKRFPSLPGQQSQWRFASAASGDIFLRPAFVHSSTVVADLRRMKLWVPHLRRVLVFAAGVGEHTSRKLLLLC